jgi:hypothetical protein
VIELPDEVYSLGLGETANGLICPVCGGGQRRDRSFSCTKVELGFVYVCFRGKCGARGFVRSGTLDASSRTRVSGESDKKRKDYERPITATPPEVRERLYSRYRIRSETLDYFGVGWSPACESSTEPQANRVARLVVPVLRPDGSNGGLVARAIEPTDEPKALTYIPRPGCMSWFRAPEVGRLLEHPLAWVVEDQFSAMRLWQEDVTAVALLGTHLNHERAIEISSVNPDRVIIALDKDATAKAVGYAQQFRYALNLQVVALRQDIKDLDEESLKELIKNAA